MTPRELKPCPFCGSDDVDAKGWLAGDGGEGPQCMNCGATSELEWWNTRAALEEKPLSRKWREVGQEWYGESRKCNDDYGRGYCRGYTDASEKCADDLDAQHDEGRELLRRMVEAVDNFNNTRPEKMVDHVWALGSLLKVTDEARNHLGGESDEA